MREGMGQPGQRLLTDSEKKMCRCYSLSKPMRELFSVQGAWHSPNT